MNTRALNGDGSRRLSAPLWHYSFAGLGLAWNAFGLCQFAGSFRQTTESLMTQGVTGDQAAIYLSLPVWMSVAFAVGVIGGAIGSVFLVLRDRRALPVLAVSFAGYIGRFSGDVAYDVYDIIPSQFAVLIVVVLVAATLLGLALLAARKKIFA